MTINYAEMAKKINQLKKSGAFIPSPQAAGAPPMDPAMAGGGMPMDPAMAGGMPPAGMPMDPAMAGGAPMDPAMAGGAPGGDMAAQDAAIKDLMKQAVREVMAEGGAPAEGAAAPGEGAPAEGDLSARVEQLEAMVGELVSILTAGAPGMPPAPEEGGGVPPAGPGVPMEDMPMSDLMAPGGPKMASETKANAESETNTVSTADSEYFTKMASMLQE